MGCCSSYTIPEGTQTAVYDKNGKLAVVEGPARLWSYQNKFDNLDRFVASEDEYLIMKFRDGKTELRQGPISVYRHPLEHESISIKQSTKLAEQELIVVYKPREKGQGSAADVKRELVRGPSIYVPSTVSEWTHEFSWTGTDMSDRDTNSKAVKRVSGLKFTKLRTNPGKTYIDIENVRTKDNALLTVKTMIFFRYDNIETMLNNTNDPFGDMINAISADIIEWCAPKKFDQFIVETDVLNTLDPYNQLRSTTDKIGMKIDKVVFRGYEAPPSLQKLHDGAIEKRTALALAKERDEEEHRLADFKLKRESERAVQQAQLEMSRCEHDLKLKKITAEAEQKRREQEYELETKRLREIKAIDPKVDLGSYLIARECQLPPVIQCGTLMSGQAPQVKGVTDAEKQASGVLARWGM